jgi:hypothetical protein
MRIKGKSNIEPADIENYKSVAIVAADISKRIANELTPTFIVEEAIAYFSDRDEFETCQQIKMFYESNPSFFLDISRAEWFGTMRTVRRVKNS